MSTPVAIVGSGNIGTDLLEKLRRSEVLEVVAVVGVDPESAGLARARSYGIDASAEGVDWLLAGPNLPVIVFEATSAYVHAANAPRYRELGILAVDLTPAALGPLVVPPVNLHQHLDSPNVNMVTCGGQATVPMVHAVARVVPVEYAEIIASVSSASVGPGTRANIDEFTKTTAMAVEVLGGARSGKAIIILNPAEPPLIMRDTIFCSIEPGVDRDAIVQSVFDMERDVQRYVPGYRLLREPQFDDEKVAIFVEVEGAGDFLPTYAGNLDIMTAAATRVGEEMARSLTGTPA
jgi:acetaldehyde dehydrogenase